MEKVTSFRRVWSVVVVAIVLLTMAFSLVPVSVRASSSEVLRPNGEGYQTQISYQEPDTGYHWEKVDEVNSDGVSTYLRDSTMAWYRDLYAVQDHSVGTDVIESVTVYLRCWKQNQSYPGYVSPSIRTEGNSFNGTQYSLTTSEVTYSQTWTVNPQTAVAWTWTEVDDVQIGWAAYAYGGTGQVYCTQVWLSVQYGVQWDLDVSSTTGGAVTTPGESVYEYDDEEVVNLVADADSGYEFIEWTGDITTIDNPYAAETHIDMLADYEIVANFAVVGEWSLHAVLDSHDGHITAPGEGEFFYDDEEVVNLVAVMNEGLVFDEWAGEDVSTIDDVNDATTTIEMLDDYTIYACFDDDPLTDWELEIVCGEGGHLSEPGTVVNGWYEVFAYADEAVVDLVALPASGYEFVSWSGDVLTVDDVNDVTTTIEMFADYEIEANFQLIFEGWTLDVSCGAGGSVTDPGIGSFEYEDEEYVDLVAVADEGKTFLYWSGDVGTIDDTEDATTTIQMLNDYEVVANFAEVVVREIPVTACGLKEGAPYITFQGGRIGIDNLEDFTERMAVCFWNTNIMGQVVGYQGMEVVSAYLKFYSSGGGGSVIIGPTAQYISLWEVEDFLSDGVSWLRYSLMQFWEVPGGDLIVLVADVDHDGNYTCLTADITDLVAALCEQGEPMPLYLMYKYNYEGVSQGARSRFIGDTSKLVEDGINPVLIVTLVGEALPLPPCETEWTVTLSSTEGGSVTEPGEGEFTYCDMSLIHLTAVADEGFRFFRWSGDIDPIQYEYSGEQQHVGIHEDLEIVAEFVAEEGVAVEIQSTDGGDVVIPGEGMFFYDFEEVVSVTAEAYLGYHFTEWLCQEYAGDMVDLGEVKYDETIDFEVLVDCFLTANFQLDLPPEHETDLAVNVLEPIRIADEIYLRGQVIDDDGHDVTVGFEIQVSLDSGDTWSAPFVFEKGNPDTDEYPTFNADEIFQMAWIGEGLPAGWEFPDYVVYQIRAMIGYGEVLGEWDYWAKSEVLYWPHNVGGLDLDVMTWVSDLWEGAGGKWILLILLIAAEAILFRKHKAIGVIVALALVALWIVLGWVDVWIVALLAIGAGFAIWGLLRGRSKGGGD
jgi:hypothetical protein